MIRSRQRRKQVAKIRRMVAKYDPNRLDRLKAERDNLRKQQTGLSKKIRRDVKAAVKAKLTYAEIGRRLGMTGERVRQIAESEEVQSTRARTLLVKTVPAQRAGGE